MTAALALGVWLAGAQTGAATNFGTRSLDADSFGSLASLSTPSSHLFQEQDEFVVHRTVVQSSNENPGLIQAGVYRSGSGIQLDNCGARSGYVVFTEVLAAGTMGYKCQLYFPVSPGAIVSMDIFRLPTADTWGIRIDGAPTGGRYSLGFSKGAPALGSEIQDVDNNIGTQAATRYGPQGHAQWSVYPTVGRSRPHRVGAGDSSFLYAPKDRFWKVPRPPARMTIKHRQ